MSNRRTVRVTAETNSGLNTKFVDTTNGLAMTRGKFADQIEAGKYPDYHVRVMDGRRIPASNPNSSEKDNLG